MFERAMIGLHLGLVAAVLALSLAALGLGRRFELLLDRGGAGGWWLIAAWLLVAALVALVPRRVMQWRVGLLISAAGLLAAALAGVWRGAPQAGAVAVGLTLLALVLMLVAQQVRAQVKKVPVRAAQGRAAAPDQVTAKGAGIGIARRLAWWIWAMCMVGGFIVANVGASNAARGIGYVAMLLGFFVMLPALSVAGWFPRVAGLCWLLAALALAAVAYAAADPGCAVGAGAVLVCAALLGRATPRDADAGEVGL
jgi:hypothetical protein